MWTRKPADWPDDVPFMDPNNKNKQLGRKPDKEELFPMLCHLLKTYVR